jgi:chain length determinant protein EpsF
MDPLLFFRALRARCKLFALAFGITLITSLALSVLMPRMYRATASLVVDTRQEQSLSTALDVLSGPRERTAYLQTQVDIIRSPTVARRAVDKLGLADRQSLIEDYEDSAGKNSASIEDWLASRLLRNLEVETTQSSVVHLSYLSQDARDSAGTANAFAEAYMEAMLELKVEPTRQAAAWFDQQLTTLRADLQEAQARMTTFQQERGIVSSDERLDDTNVRFEELSSQLLRAQEQAVESEILAGSARRALDGGEMSDLPELLNDSYLRELDLELLAGESRLYALATQYGPNHPEYQHLRAENAAKRQTRNAEALEVLSSAERSAEQAWQRVAEIEKLLDAQRERLLDQKGSRDTLAVLKRNVDTAQNAYDTAMQRYVVSQVESRASQTNVAMLSRASAPAVPYRPNLLLNVALAVVAGSMLGGGLVALAELSDRRVRSATDLREIVATPVLGELTDWSPSKHALLPHFRDDEDASGGTTD